MPEHESQFTPKSLEEAKTDPNFLNYVLDEMDFFVTEKIKQIPSVYLTTGLMDTKYSAAINSVAEAESPEEIKSIAIDLAIVMKEDSVFEQTALAKYNFDLEKEGKK